jgi:hypothetical protein
MFRIEGRRPTNPGDRQVASLEDGIRGADPSRSGRVSVTMR